MCSWGAGLLEKFVPYAFSKVHTPLKELRNVIESGRYTNVPNDFEALIAFHKDLCSRHVLPHNNLSR